MSFDDLFENRNIAAEKLKSCIRDQGYTKVSFAEKAGISRPTLNKLIAGTIDSKSTFDRHFQKVLRTLNMSVDEFMLFTSNRCAPIEAVFSENAPADHEMNDTAKKQYSLLLDVLDLCAIYY